VGNAICVANRFAIFGDPHQFFIFCAVFVDKAFCISCFDDWLLCHRLSTEVTLAALGLLGGVHGLVSFGDWFWLFGCCGVYQLAGFIMNA
jgi:hypothetical protein